MTHFAKVENGVVTAVLVIDQAVIDTGLFGDPAKFVQTSYSTHGGVHDQGGTPLRKNFAAIGYTYDAVRDAFIPPKPFPSWVLDETTCLWNAPTAVPDARRKYRWDEVAQVWVEIRQDAIDGVPQTVTRRQARQALLLAGLLDFVPGAIAAIPDATQRGLATIEWEDSQVFDRDRPLLMALATALGLSSAQLDALFVQAAAL